MTHPYASDGDLLDDHGERAKSQQLWMIPHQPGRPRHEVARGDGGGRGLGWGKWGRVAPPGMDVVVLSSLEFFGPPREGVNPSMPRLHVDLVEKR